MKKEVTPKTQRGLSQGPLMEKEATPKNTKGLIKKDLRGKSGIPKFPTNTLINQSQLR
jgi:hypothetical protein